MSKGRGWKRDNARHKTAAEKGWRRRKNRYPYGKGRRKKK